MATELDAPRDRNDPRHWRLGFLYHNPEDPALFVPRRHGLGETVNFAHPQARLVLFTVFAPLLIVLLLLWIFVWG